MRPAMFTLVARSPTLDPALAATIRRLREERGISREGLAFRSMISTGSLARIELGKSVPGWDTVRLLAKALDIPLVELVAAIEASRDCITPAAPGAARACHVRPSARVQTGDDGTQRRLGAQSHRPTI